MNNNKESKTISIVITLVIILALLTFLSTYKITYSDSYSFTPNTTANTTDTLSKVDDEQINMLEKLNLQELIIDSLKRAKDSIKSKMVKEIDKKNDTIALLKKYKTESTKEADTKVKSENITNARKLIQFIPGTMGAKGTLPKHACKTKGVTLEFDYTANKNGYIISVKKKSGPKNTCLENTAVKWIQNYVRSDKGTKSFTGVYTIKF